MEKQQKTIKNHSIKQKATHLAEVIQVIHTVSTRGEGTKEDPIITVHQYWSKDGQLLAQKDIL